MKGSRYRFGILLFGLLLLIAYPCLGKEPYTVTVTQAVDSEVEGEGLNISGTIKNNTSTTLRYVVIEINLYDASGELLDVGVGTVNEFKNPNGVLPGKTGVWLGFTTDQVVHASDVKSALAVAK